MLLGVVVASIVALRCGFEWESIQEGMTIAYAPFAFFCWLSPLVTILYGYMGWTITPLDEADGKEEASVEVRPAEA